MFEAFRYGFHAKFAVTVWGYSIDAYKAANIDMAIVLADKSLSAARKALDLGRKLFDGQPERIELLEKLIGDLEKYRKEVEGYGRALENRNIAKNQFIDLASRMGVVGDESDHKDFVASVSVDMYRIAKDRLGAGREVIEMIYVDNVSAPEPLRKLMKSYVDGEITKEVATQELDAMAKVAENFAEAIGANPHLDKRPKAIYFKK